MLNFKKVNQFLMDLQNPLNKDFRESLKKVSEIF